MKGIIKQQEPESFTKWKAQANEDWQPTFDKLQNPEKRAVRTSLVEEQGYICAYCCRAIEDNSRTTVIEHFIPQSDENDGKANQLNYDNLFASCDGTLTDNKSKKAIYCCDESKKDQFYKENTGIAVIKPTLIDDEGFVCESTFGYSIDGSIFGNEGRYLEAANFSIEVLNLDNDELKRGREAALYFLFEDIENALFFDFSSEEVQTLKTIYASKTNGRFEPFCQTVLYFLNQYYP